MADAPANKSVNLLLKNVLLRLADFSLEADLEIQSRVTAIFGPSGAGKTSLLDLIAGLRHPESALIRLGDQVLTDTSTRTFVSARHRRIGYVPQDLALFPHLSVKQNLLYGHKAEASANSLFSYEHVVKVLEIQAHTERRVQNLSGGEKQRVALARARVLKPRLMLLDEPTASLDGEAREQVIALIPDLIRSGASVIIACHDRDLINLPEVRRIKLRDGRLEYR
jgi:molybdate transport system ATP-binding protein